MAIEILEDGTVLKSQEDLTPEELGKIPGARPQTEAEYKAKEAERKELTKAFAVLRAKIVEGGRFTDAQMDLGVSMLFSRLDATDVAWIKELSGHVISRPVWQLFAGWFKLLQERGEVTSAIFDPAWEQNQADHTERALCASCGKEFAAERFGQVFCSGKCGAAAEKAARANEQTAIDPMAFVR